jgi:Ribbon-helix-helix protein, copG family
MRARRDDQDLAPWIAGRIPPARPGRWDNRRMPRLHPQSHRVSVRLGELLLAKLDAVAEARGVPRSTVIREAVEVALTAGTSTSIEQGPPMSRADLRRALEAKVRATASTAAVAQLRQMDREDEADRGVPPDVLAYWRGEAA